MRRNGMKPVAPWKQEARGRMQNRVFYCTVPPCMKAIGTLRKGVESP
jgi:hypothetical protein